ncbi:MAG: DeoR/GlpR transcriptional regulator [Bacteroidetes bacterium]|nr:DeoR/GlpR transcriptional regulator [Bacteroidota bacterium]
MQKTDRQDYIIHQVNLHNKVLLPDLSDQLHVSNDTIRRDLQELADEGKIIKVHGGAVSLSFHNKHHSGKEVYAYNQKKIIAKKAVELIENGMFILTGGGTTVIEMAKELSPALNATFISGSLHALIEYSNHPHVNVIAIGDKVSKTSHITVGSEAISKIRELKVDICFMGINAINIEDGVSDNDWDIVQIKKAMILSSNKLVCLTISEKINSRQPIPICGINKIDVLITELPPNHPLLQPYIKAGIEVL